MKGRTCVSCVYYDGEICTKDIEEIDINVPVEEFYRAPFDTCDEHEEYFEEDE